MAPLRSSSRLLLKRSLARSLKVASVYVCVCDVAFAFAFTFTSLSLSHWLCVYAFSYSFASAFAFAFAFAFATERKREKDSTRLRLKRASERCRPKQSLGCIVRRRLCRQQDRSRLVATRTKHCCDSNNANAPKRKPNRKLR